jgi:hypothetical protein
VAGIRDRIWYDLLDAKCGEEYMVLYLARQRKVRKWFKIGTILLSAGGIFSAFKSAEIPTIITCTCIGIVQLATSIENHLIHSEDALENLSRLRQLYYNRTNKLEVLWDLLGDEKITDDDASKRFYKLRESASEIETLDAKQGIPVYGQLRTIAEKKTQEYLNKHHYEQT